MLSNTRLKDSGLQKLIPMDVLIVDEASQIELGDYLGPLHDFKTVLRRIVFVGDDKQRELFSRPHVTSTHASQVAPYGSDEIPELQSIFDIPAHRSRAHMLDTSCEAHFILSLFLF